MKKIKKSIYYTAIATLLITSAAQANSTKPVIVNSDTIEWHDAKGIPAGAKIAILAGDPQKKEPFVVRIKLPANYNVPTHIHLINEYDTVLSGTLYVKIDNSPLTVSAGNFVMIPARHPHNTWTKEETILQISGMGPWGTVYSNKS